MAILYDWEFKKAAGVGFNDIPNDIQILLTQLKRFIRDRLKVLEDKTELHPAGFTIIHLRFSNFKISHYEYPYELTKSLEDCISDEDLNYIATRLLPKE